MAYALRYWLVTSSVSLTLVLLAKTQASVFNPISRLSDICCKIANRNTARKELAMTAQTKIVGESMQTERREDGQRILLRDLKVEIEGDPITVPAGTTTDFSSIPWYGRILVRWSKVDIAGVVHDWLYESGDTSRARADAIWRLLAVSGEHSANAIQAYIGWFALRIGGWIAWHRYRQKEVGTTTKDELKPLHAG